MPVLAAELLCAFVAIPYGAERSQEGTLMCRRARRAGSRVPSFVFCRYHGATGIPEANPSVKFARAYDRKKRRTGSDAQRETYSSSSEDEGPWHGSSGAAVTARGARLCNSGHGYRIGAICHSGR